MPSLSDVAAAYAGTITASVTREYPNALRHVMTGDGDTPTPRTAHPAFYGCFDWHSAVEMHWALVRMLRTVPDAFDADAARAVIDAHLTPAKIAAETDYLRRHPGFERPYGWGWALALADELAGWDDPDGRRWWSAVAPLADALADAFVRWLPRAAHPQRDGMHGNSAFALARAYPYARRVPGVKLAVDTTALRWFAGDRDYPAAWEPSGADFLSPALAEVELMALVLPDFPAWLAGFLPGLAEGRPAALFTPVEVGDASDGQTAHLHGLNLYRAHGLGVAAGGVADGSRLRAAADAHATASLPMVCGADYMVEHWLAAFAVLLLGGDQPSAPG